LFISLLLTVLRLCLSFLTSLLLFLHFLLTLRLHPLPLLLLLLLLLPECLAGASSHPVNLHFERDFQARTTVPEDLVAADWSLPGDCLAD